MLLICKQNEREKKVKICYQKKVECCVTQDQILRGYTLTHDIRHFNLQGLEYKKFHVSSERSFGEENGGEYNVGYPCKCISNFRTN